MKKKKILIAFIILILMVAGFIAIASAGNLFTPKKLSYRQDLKVSGIVNTIKRVEEQMILMDSEFSRIKESSAELMVYALRQFVTEDGYEGPEVFDTGILLRTEKGAIVYPEGAPIRIQELGRAEDLDRMSALTGTTVTASADDGQTLLLTVKSVTDGIYYVEWTDPDDYQAFVNDRVDLAKAVRTMEKSYSSGLLLVSDQESDQHVIYNSEKFGTVESLNDIGLTGDILVSEPSRIRIGDTLYSAAYERMTFRGQPVRVIVLSEKISSDTYNYTCIIIGAGFILLCMTCLILWIGWVADYVRVHTLTESQQKAYSLSKQRKTAASVGLIGAILLMLLLIAYQLMGNLSQTSAGNQEMLDIIMARLENDSSQETLVTDGTTAREMQDAKRVAELYGKYPELRNREFLSKAAGQIGCEFIMIFDGNGDEIMSSNAYVDFTLGAEIASTEDFRFLLKGVEQIIHEPERDLYTGNMIQLAGIRIDLPDQESYNAMILAFNWTAARENNEKQEIAGYINMLTPRGYLSLVVSQKNDRIVYSSNADYVGDTPKELGLDESDLIPTSLSPYEILRRKTYGAFNENEQYRCYYIMEAEKIWENTVIYAAGYTLAYLLICLIISLYLLGPVRIDRSQESAFLQKKASSDRRIRIDKETLEKKNREFTDFFQEESVGERSLKEWWRDLTPGKKVLKLLNLLVTIIQVVIIAALLVKDETGSDSVIGFVLNGSWKRGVNDLALMSIFCVSFILLAFILLKGWLVKALCSILNAKGETITRLVSSLLQYLAIITAICFCLSYLGLDTGTLITSAGIMTLAISLGSRDLVADILSGIFIIFEGDFQVGDIIDVNGFRGRVLDIGVRSTKLIDSSKNIKIIDNQSVKNILNLSKENSWFFISLTLSNTQPLEEIEALLDRELPDIGKDIPTIINGPFYFGIDTIGYRRVTITIGAESRQQDVNKSKSILNHALWEIFEKNGYRL